MLIPGRAYIIRSDGSYEKICVVIIWINYIKDLNYFGKNNGFEKITFPSYEYLVVKRAWHTLFGIHSRYR